MNLGVSVQPLVHVPDVPAAVAFYQAFGATIVHANDDGDFALIDLGGTRIGLLGHPPNPAENTGPVELTFVAESLDEVLTRATTDAITIATPITTTVFGRQLTVLTADGHQMKINEFRF